MAAAERMTRRTPWRRASPQRRRGAVTGYLFILPSLLGLTAFVAAPFMMSLYYTFTQGISRVRFVGLDNFAALIGNPTFSLAVRNTLIFTGIGAPLALALALAFSLMMAGGGFNAERWALLSPLMVPVSAVIAGWRYLLDAAFFVDERYMMAFVIILYVWKNTGYLIVIFTSAIAVIPREYREVFVLESKSGVQLTLRVILPLIAPMAFFAAVIAVMNSFKIFREVFVLFGADPPWPVYMLQHFMNNNFLKLNYQRLSTAAFLLASIIFILIWLCLKAQKRYLRDM